MHQSAYLKKVVSKFGLLNCKPLASHFILSKLQCPVNDSEILEMEDIPYSNTVGTVMFSMINIRPDLVYSISLLSRYISTSGKEQWNALKHLLRYINSSLHAGLCYKNWTNTLDLVGYVDSDFVGDRDSRK